VNERAAPDRLACTGIRLTPRPLVRFVQAAGFFVAGWALLFAILSGNAFFLLWMAAFAAAPAVITHYRRRRIHGEVELDPGGLRWRQAGEESAVRTERITGGHLVRKFRAPLVEPSGPLSAAGREARPQRSVLLQLDNGSQWQVDLETRDDAERVLSHVGLDAGKRAVVAPLRGVLGAFTRGLLAFCVAVPLLMAFSNALLGPARSWVGLLLALVVTIFWVKRYGYPQVVVGTDGIRLIGRLLPRFVPYAEITDAQRGVAHDGSAAGASGVELSCKNGRRLFLPTIAQTEDAEQALVERIRAGIKAYGQAGEDRLMGALERRGRPIQAWKDDLKRVAVAEAGFRQQAFGREDFERVLTDPSAAAERRVGAALALRGMDEEAAPRIRIAAAASANPKLRVALEAAAEGEVDEAALGDAREGQGG
jgi:hypothetical protein